MLGKSIFLRNKMMDRFKNKKTEVPLCKFGPGGDYISELKPDNLNILNPEDENMSPLGKVLYVIADIIGSTVQPEILTEAACVLPTAQTSGKPRYQEIIKNVQSTTQSTDGDHPKTTAGPSANWKLSTEPMLFSNDWGTGSGTHYKSSYRVRTHRRSSRKKAVSPIHGQGSLFEAHRPRRKTA